MKNSKKTLLSVFAIILSLTMVAGMTLAYFTDSASSSKNIIASGNLDVEMHWTNKLDGDNTSWYNAEDEDDGVPFDYAKWEPGYTEVRYVKIVNAGKLAFKYSLSLDSLGAVGKLAEVIGVYYAKGVSTNVAGRDLAGLKNIGYLCDNIGTEAAYGALNSGDSVIVAIALKMDESAGNEYQGASVGDGFIFKLVATQASVESDDFGKDYDDAVAMVGNSIHFESEKSVADSITNGALDENVTIGAENNTVYAEIPAGVQMADGETELTLSVDTVAKFESEANITLEKGEVANTLDIHVDGISEDNTVPMIISLKGLFQPGLNDNNVKIYHVENGVTNPMTLVSAPKNHNEFSYDPLTGDVVVAMASFSEVATVADTIATWDGSAADGFNSGDGSEASPYIIANASQLAYFRKQVDGGNTFDDKFIRLGADVDLNGVNFDPIGWGYDYKDYNVGDVAGNSFKGTFDGGNNTIYNLYQSGWDLESTTGTDYTYTNCGFGLFASATNATFKNLTISGANIAVECVEAGILVGLSQGNCTYSNIEIRDSKIANYQRPAGGVVGEVSPATDDDGKNWYGEQTFTSVEVRSDVVVGSLWGDFDTPVGGVIGARWDDSNVTTVNMSNVTVASKLDVYNDVTSTYQWYAYRRAGMLIGNTDTPPADGKNSKTATADFLNCSNVQVYYGDWVNYHYCEFTNHNSSWPWVRVEAGENCSAYSNPRYGVPNDKYGNKVTNADHTHAEGDTCSELIAFNQLYGGGQGIYGQPQHDGVTTSTYAYTIQYLNDNDVLAETYVESNKSDFTLTNDLNYNSAKSKAEEWVKAQGYSVEFGGWVNAGSTKVTAVPAGNTENIKLYPYFNSPYTARFVDQSGNVLAWCLFHSEKTTELENTRTLAESKLTFDEGFSLDHWEVHATDTPDDYNVSNFATYTSDVTIYPVFKYNGDVSLIPVDEDGDGDTDYYQVSGYGANTGEQELVEIPGVVNGVPVTVINSDAFSSYDDLHSVRIPGTITSISSQAFTADDPDRWGEQRDTVTLYYEGDPEIWKKAMEMYNLGDYSGMMKEKWDNYMGESSCVFFLGEDGKVDLSKGYWELAEVKDPDSFLGLGSKFEWQYHNHTYGSNSGCSNEHNNTTNYSGNCDCNSCNGADRPDAEYWN